MIGKITQADERRQPSCLNILRYSLFRHD